MKNESEMGICLSVNKFKMLFYSQMMIHIINKVFTNLFIENVDNYFNECEI
jgi:hypothetical protein